MRKMLFLAICLLMFECVVFAGEKGMKLTVNLKNALIIDRAYVMMGDTKEEIVLGEDKTGSLEIALDEGQYATLKIGYAKNLLYIEPGKNLTLTLIANKDGSFSFQKNVFEYEGEKENERINKYLNENGLKFLETIDFVLDEDEFLNKLAEFDKENSKLIKKAKFPKEFEEQELLRVKYLVYDPLVRYPVQHFWKNGGEWSGMEQYEETPKVKALIPQLFMDSEQAWNIYSYRGYLQGGIGIIAQSEFMSNDKKKATLEQLSYLTEHFKTPIILEDITQDLTLRYIEVTEGKPLGEIETYYNRNVKSEACRQELERALKMWAKFSKRTEVMSSDYKYQDINGKMVSLDDLKGKYVYIDVWATWCGPCKAELPYLKELEKKFEGKNIHFVSISVDANKAAWVKMVQAEQLGGIQLHGGSKAQIMKDYMIKGIPRFILLDREGKVIEKEMTRPSNPDTEKTLNALEGI
ncbi:TlpA disulfide reductase family protein [uncultured Butyricimonas sp.]|uniref:TlpA family protein disulfide reductase n=1 Tax=uncultured Butyricimonas sp. TaxID=1268785 RepID=UPI0026DD235F|nr:TlpA disulfide reductase family protein [uncultured Butyricimonas sp.]